MMPPSARNHSGGHSPYEPELEPPASSPVWWLWCFQVAGFRTGGFASRSTESRRPLLEAGITAQVFTPGDKVARSGIYRVTHDTVHRQEHEVTCVAGEHFPPCNDCGPHPRFVLKYHAQHVRTHENFVR